MNVPVIDGHNDSLACLTNDAALGIKAFLRGRSDGHVDAPRAKSGALRAGFFALHIPPDPSIPEDDEIVFTPNGYEVPLAHPITRRHAWKATTSALKALSGLIDASAGELFIVRNSNDLERCISSDKLGVIVHLEGAEAIDPDLDGLPILYEAGLRSLGVVWSRPNAFGTGVPFRFPHSPDTGPGLTDAGIRLVKACNQLGIMLDVSHLNEKGFWDLAAHSQAPLVASHSAAHSLCQSSRNLTDKQLDAICDTHGLVGVNFEVSALRSDSQNDPHTSLEPLLEHIDYMVTRMGIDYVGFGSDFDGATMSHMLPDAAALPVLVTMLKERYGLSEVKKLCCENWIRVLRMVWRRDEQAV